MLNEKEPFNKTMWYKNPADQWENAMPIGNGRLAAMVFGQVKEEFISINEESLWSGKLRENNNPEAFENLSKVRELLFKGKPVEAYALAGNKLMGNPCTLKPYEPVGELKFSFYNHENYINYKRELDLENGLAIVKYEIENTTFEREYFVSAVDQVIVIKFSSHGIDKLNFSIAYNREKDAQIRLSGSNELILDGKCDGGEGMSFCSYLKVITKGGEITSEDNKIKVLNADSAVIIINAMTDYKKKQYKELCINVLEKAIKKPYELLREEHIKDYKSFFDRVSLRLEAKDEPIDLPTDERLNRVKAGCEDNGLIKLYFDFGRYLLISSSRAGCLPANLQGKWNGSMKPAWNSDYHLNINLQMNYWPAEVCNLSECHTPLFDYLDFLRVPGRKTAKIHYGCTGFVAHHISDVWGFTVPGDGPGCGVWPTGVAWLCDHLWEHYLFTQDRKFLKEKAYPIMKEAAEFLLDYMVEDSKGRLVCGPSVSPENSYKSTSGEIGKLCMGASMDSQITTELFMHCMEASAILEIEDEFTDKVKLAQSKLPKLSIGKYGQLMEWSEDYEEVELGHRHISHLFALYPGSQINIDLNPEFAKAAEVTLERRLANGGGHTGWSAAWIISFWARLKNSERAYETLMKLLKDSTAPSLLDLHPPFQIDGNFGGTAAIAEMLVQSHGDKIELLPALPKEWKDGEVKGLRVRKGGEINIRWQDGKIIEARLKALCNNTFEIKIPLKQHPKIIKDGINITIGDEHIATLEMNKGDEAILKF